jgi:hypothetical protein
MNIGKDTMIILTILNRCSVHLDTGFLYNIVNQTKNIYNTGIHVHPTASNGLFQSYFEAWEPGFSIFKTCT